MTLNAQQQKVLNDLLIEAVGKRDLPRMKTYVSKGANISVNVDQAETIARSGNTYSARGNGPLYHYMMQDYFENAISDFFFEQGVKVDVKNFNGNTPLMIAVKNGNLGRVKYFLSKGADPMALNNGGEMVLEEARKLQSYYCTDRQSIIDALVNAIGGAPVAAASAPAAPAAPAETAQTIQTLKPIEFAPRKKPGGGFNL